MNFVGIPSTAASGIRKRSVEPDSLQSISIGSVPPAYPEFSFPERQASSAFPIERSARFVALMSSETQDSSIFASSISPLKKAMISALCAALLLCGTKTSPRSFPGAMPSLPEAKSSVSLFFTCSFSKVSPFDPTALFSLKGRPGSYHSRSCSSCSDSGRVLLSPMLLIMT